MRNRGSYRPGPRPVKDRAFDRKVEAMLQAQAERLALREKISTLKAANKAIRKTTQASRPGREAWKDRLEADKAAKLAASCDAETRAFLARASARP